MSYTVEEFKPRNPILIVDGREIKLSLITLDKEVFYIENYGSLPKAINHLREKPEEMIEFIWQLVVDKNCFENKYEVFKNVCLKAKEPLKDIAIKMKKCFDESVSKSSPMIKNVKRYKEIQEINGSQTDSKPCYVVYFDTVSKRYGLNLEEFYGLTLGQLHIMLKTIGDQSYRELETQAALQGRKLKPRMEFNDISPEEEAEQEADALSALARLQKEHEEKTKGKK